MQSSNMVFETQIQLSGKVLGELAQPNCCERCFWVKVQMRQQFPYSIFPGIFSSIDAFTKKVIHGFMDTFGHVPSYLQEIGEIEQYVKPPHHKNFRYHDPATNILLTGEADGIFRLIDGSLAIVDYKTAKCTKNQDEMFHMYHAQLNSYALIAETLGMGSVSKLALIYMEPLTDCPKGMGRFCSSNGVQLHFHPKIVYVKRDDMLIPKLLQRASTILKASSLPEGHPECKNCKQVERFISLFEVCDETCI